MKWHSCCPPHNLMETTGRFLSFYFFSFFFFFTYTASSGTTCSPSSCGPGTMVQKVRFPFRLKDRQSDRCGCPGFDLSCNNQNQTILNLPYAGEFIVNEIDYINQWIFINDPDYCLPERILNFSLSDSQFRGVYPRRNFTFLNCSSGLSDNIVYGAALPIYCLSKNPNYTVIATTGYDVPSTCQNMSTVRVPIQWPIMSLTNDLQLAWRTPSCRPCEAARGTCGFKGDTEETECSNLPSRGLPRSAKYGIIIGLGIPGLVCFIGLACYVGSRIRTCGRGRQFDAELSNAAITSQPAGGLDGPTIESYPKTVLGESGRLPKPSDGTCPICLAEYLPKESLRTIPECNHYFHATCIDEWLKMNATCPLCRNSPAESSLATPCSSMSLSSSSSSSLTS